LAAKDENHAIGATFFFNIMHYALRPWPWILVALASLVVYPDIASIQAAFPNVEAGKLGHDLAYSAMLTKLPAGLLGLVLASLGAAYMSTLSTHLNWGASYIVNDVYRLNFGKNSSEKHLVLVGRIATVLLMVFSALFALVLQNALQLFDIILMFGAGTGLIFILRWFWWRINAWSELSAMVSSGIISILLNFTSLGTLLFAAEGGVFPSWFKFPFVVLITTIVWIAVTYATPKETDVTLQKFYDKIKPGGPGWKKQAAASSSSDKKWTVPSGILAALLSAVLIYSVMFSVGNLIYGNTTKAFSLFALALAMLIWLLRVWKKLKKDVF
jgi:SSS family solute:Na+ symporter